MTSVATQLETAYRQDYGRILASLIGAVRDFGLAEDALQEAMVAALESWPVSGIPANPAGWLAAVARRRAIDRLRRNAILTRKQSELQALAEIERQTFSVPGAEEPDEIPDERLKLLFTCCHPALALDARVALTLRTLGGLRTEEIASAFLIPLPTMAQRLVRAQRKILDAGIPYAEPPVNQLAERLDGVFAVLYLIFNEGYTATAGDTLMRRDLCEEAIRLTRILADLCERDPAIGPQAEALGLLALMRLHHARRHARVDATGELVLLEAQDRSLWDSGEIVDGTQTLDRALALRQVGPYQVQAAIAALHDQARRPEDTDWGEIALLYGRLACMAPSPIIELNHAVAVAMARGPEVGLALLEQLSVAPALERYHHYHAARADLLRRAGRTTEARASYEQALSLCQNDIERRFLRRRLAELTGHEKTPTRM
ncbi:MAG TPA: RNA polymerase sigma factor [Ktedonobacterales bacterium]|nr:RNA polymerase sigma factor [Ktedonobacterales bacterium]